MSVLRPEICFCSTLKSKIVFKNIYDNNKKINFFDGNTWMINQWNKKSHPSHFAFKMVPTGIIFNSREEYKLPNIIERLYWQDYESSALTDFESNIFDIPFTPKG